MAFDGGQRYALHPMTDILAAILRVRANVVDRGNRHQLLVLKWVGISITKETIAASVRDLCRMLPERRNELRLDIDVSGAAGDGDGAAKDSVAIKPKRLGSPYRYAIPQADGGKVICLVISARPQLARLKCCLSMFMTTARKLQSAFCVLLTFNKIMAELDCSEGACTTPFAPFLFLPRRGLPQELRQRRPDPTHGKPRKEPGRVLSTMRE